MSTTTANTVSREDLEARIASGEQAARQAESDLEDAALDGTAVDEVEARRDAARADAARARAALRALDRREATERQGERERVEAARRSACFAWKAEALARQVALIDARSALSEAEAGLRALGACPFPEPVAHPTNWTGSRDGYMLARRGPRQVAEGARMLVNDLDPAERRSLIGELRKAAAAEARTAGRQQMQALAKWLPWLDGKPTGA